MFSGDMDAHSGLLRVETTSTNSVSGLLCCVITRKCKKHSKSIICVMIALVCAFVGGVIFQKYANRTETEPPVSSQLKYNETGSTHYSNSTDKDVEAEAERVDELRLLYKNCSEKYCIQCTAVIPARKSINNKTCEKESRVYNETCFLYEKICYTLEALKTLRVPLPSKCCTYAQMTNCSNGGYGVCLNDTADPQCQCQNGWRGEKCEEQFTVQCKCSTRGLKFCGEDDRVKCDNEQTNTTECSMYADRPAGKLNCICNISYDSVNGKDDEIEPCSLPHTNTTQTESKSENPEN